MIKFARISCIRFCQCGARLFSSAPSFSQLDALSSEYCISASVTHNVLIIQPAIRQADLRRKLDLNASLTTGHSTCTSSSSLVENGSVFISQMSKGPDEREARALIDSMGSWTVHDVIPVNLRSRGTSGNTFFTKGVWNELTQTIQLRTKTETENPITAVFINWKRLTVPQILEMQKAWKCPVFDRYTLVVQLFLLRSRTREAKAQAQLAELGLIRARLVALTSADTNLAWTVNSDHLNRVIDNHERRLLASLADEEKRRSLERKQRRERTQNQFPIVAVIGYTNAGKTSLIRLLSGSSNVVASPQVFATLDITHHATRIPSSSRPHQSKTAGGVGAPGLRLLMLDTIGFMADLPRELIAAFRATLTECLDAEIIIHIIDASQPDWQIFARYIENILVEAGVHSQASTSSMNATEQINVNDSKHGDYNPPVLLRVGNKCDLGSPSSIKSPSGVDMKLDAEISCTTGVGVPKLCELIESNLIGKFGWKKQKLRMRQGSEMLSWLYANAMVVSITNSPDNAEKLVCEVLFNSHSWGLFQSKVGSRLR